MTHCFNFDILVSRLAKIFDSLNQMEKMVAYKLLNFTMKKDVGWLERAVKSGTVNESFIERLLSDMVELIVSKELRTEELYELLKFLTLIFTTSATSCTQVRDFFDSHFSLPLCLHLSRPTIKTILLNN